VWGRRKVRGSRDGRVRSGEVDRAAATTRRLSAPRAEGRAALRPLHLIERDAERCRELEALKSDFPALAANIRVEQGEANAEIQKICEKNWNAHRAVLFLDPYGMQVEWQTIEAIAKTKAIDLWLLFPLGIGVSRLLTRTGEIPNGWRRRLDTLLGTTDWYDEFYKVEHTANLFGNDEIANHLSIRSTIRTTKIMSTMKMPGCGRLAKTYRW
jgi:three-Cys-motif partner protein